MNRLGTFLRTLQGKKVHVIGITGAEGSSIASFLLRCGVRDIVGHDFIPQESARFHFDQYHDWMSHRGKDLLYQRLFSGDIRFCFHTEYLSNVQEEDIIFVPQSWFRYKKNAPLQRFFHDDHSPLERYRSNIMNITRLYLMLFPGDTIGVTGSNGKSTTTALIGKILMTAYSRPETPRLFWGGNDRCNAQPLDIIDQAKEDDVLLLEISNRQLALRMGLSPHVAVLTNIVPNHLDDHGTFEKYREAKREIFRYQTKEDFAVLNFDDEQSRLSSSCTKGEILLYSQRAKMNNGVYVENGEIIIAKGGKREVVLSVHDIMIPGEHNISNVLAAVSVTSILDIPCGIIREAIRSFTGLSHRLEYVDTVGGVSFYDDSAGCNPLNIPAAIRSFSSPKIIIAGGSRPKPMRGEFYPTAEAVKQSNVKKIILIGSVQDVMEKELLEKGVERERISKMPNLQKAVPFAFSLAREKDVVILSPGCESFGEFHDYRERGEKFKKYVRGL